MGFELRQNPSSLETVNKFTKRMESATEEAKSAIRKAQEDMTRCYNRRRLSYDGKYQLINIFFFLFYIITHSSVLNSCYLLL